MVNELSKTERWLKYVLGANPTVSGRVGDRIYHDVAPEGAVYPLIVFNHQAGEDVNGVGTCRILSKNLYQLRLVTRDDLTDADRAAADAMDNILQTATKAEHPSDPTIKFTGRRESPISTTDTERNTTRRFRYLGGSVLDYSEHRVKRNYGKRISIDSNSNRQGRDAGNSCERIRDIMQP